MNVRVDLSTPIYDGMEVVFKAPCNAANVTGLKLCYQEEVHYFSFADANANDVGDLDNLFAEGAVVKVIIDTDTNKAFIQNADTNAYLENRFKEIGTGGNNRLVVTIDKGKASYTAPKIYEHIQQYGIGSVTVHRPNGDFGYMQVVFADDYVAECYRHQYGYEKLDRKIELVVIGVDGKVTELNFYHASAQDVEDLKTDMGDIETALDSILEIQNELMGGDGV